MTHEDHVQQAHLHAVSLWSNQCHRILMSVYFGDTFHNFVLDAMPTYTVDEFWTSARVFVNAVARTDRDMPLNLTMQFDYGMKGPENEEQDHPDFPWHMDYNFVPAEVDGYVVTNTGAELMYFWTRTGATIFHELVKHPSFIKWVNVPYRTLRMQYLAVSRLSARGEFESYHERHQVKKRKYDETRAYKIETEEMRKAQLALSIFTHENINGYICSFIN
jgi:hypothetical protein